MNVPQIVLACTPLYFVRQWRDWLGAMLRGAAAFRHATLVLTDRNSVIYLVHPGYLRHWLRKDHFSHIYIIPNESLNTYLVT
jgi:hypothetical protein